MSPLRKRSRLRWPTLLLGLGLAGALQAGPLLPGPGLLADGIPLLQRASSPPPGTEGQAEGALRFLDWHPLRAEMLVLASAGGSAQLHLLRGPGQTPQRLSSGPEPVNEARWEPERGDYLVFSRDQGGDEAYRLYRLPAPASAAPAAAASAPGLPAEAVALTPPGHRVSSFQFMPGGRGLVYVLDRLDPRDVLHSGARSGANEEKEEKEAKEAGDEDAAAAPPSGGRRQSHSRLFWMDPLHPDRPRLLGDAPGGRFTDLRVSPSGQILALLSLRGQGQRQNQLMRYALDGSPGRPLGETGPGPGPEAGPSEPLWERQTLQGDFRQLSVLDLGSGRRRAGPPELAPLAASADLEALAVPPPGSGRPLALVHNEQGVSVLRLYQPGGGAGAGADADAGAGGQRPAAGRLLRPADGPPPGVLRNPRWHGRLPLLAFDHVAAAYPGRIYSLDSERGVWQLWNAAATAALPPPAYQLLRWTGFDGLGLSGLHIAPPARFKGPRPVFISLHGGPSSQSRPSHLSPTLRHLVEVEGMHLILPNVRGSEGFGRSFLALDNGRLRENAVRDVSALLDLIANRPDMDAGRVLVSGGSYGGYLSLAVAVQESRRIAGSIARVAVANFVSFLENTESYRRDNRRAEYGDERDPAMREFLQRISPLSRAAEIRKPLFIVHGRNDPRVPFSEAQQMVAAVRAAGTPVWFLSAEDEGHSFRKAGNRDYLQQATLAFVRQALDLPP